MNFKNARPILFFLCVFLVVPASLTYGASKESPAAIVKTTNAPTIDGEAGDWAWLKAEHLIYGAQEPVGSFKAAYDAENFYVLIQVMDASPLKNGANVLEELWKGGDAVGICFGGRCPNQRIMAAQIAGKSQIIAMRPQWKEKRPYKYFTAAAGEIPMEFVGPVPGAMAAFKTTATGYIAEISIPWKALAIDAADRMTFPFDVQLVFSDPAGTMNASTVWWHSVGAGPLSTMDIATEAKLYPDAWGTAKLRTSDPGPRPERLREPEDESVFGGPGLPISFDMPREARASLIITRADGWVVRELLRARTMGMGKHTVYWDGRDRTGQPMPPGEYGYTLAIFDGIKTKFYGSVGSSSRPVFRTPDGLGSAGGAHGGPSAVAADATGIYMLNSGEEGPQCLRKVKPDGKALWAAGIGVFAAGVAITVEGDSVYMLTSQHQGTTLLTRLVAATGRAQKIGSKDGPIDIGKTKKQGLAVAGGKIYFSESEKNRIGVIDAQTGVVEADIALDSPSGLWKLDDGRILACSGTNVVLIELATRAVTPLIQNLAKPRAVAVDPTGAIYVSDLGASQQIKKFAPLQAGATHLIATFGKLGGRALTVLKYDPLEFLNVSHMTIGPDGNLWMVEQANSPRRYIRLTLEGKWLEDFYGPAGFSTVGVDLDDLSSVYYQTTQYRPEYVQARVDYEQYAKDPGNPVGAWKPEALWNLTQNCVDDSAKPDVMSEIGRQGYGKALIFTGTNGKRYFWKPVSDACGLWILEAGRWKSAVSVYRLKGTDGKETGHTLWTDANGDGLVQEDELSKLKIPTGKWNWIDRDLTLHGQDGSWKPASVDARGVPSYVGGAFTAVFAPDAPKPAFYLDQENYGISLAPPAPGGVRYYASNIGPEGGHNFWDRASETRLTKFRDGRVEWIIGHHDGKMRHDSDSMMLMNLSGEIDGIVVATEVWGNFIAYTTDGLTLGWMCTDERGGLAQDGPNSITLENVAPGILAKDPKTGKRLLFATDAEDVRVLEIDGVFGDQLVRKRGTVTLNSAFTRIESFARQYCAPYSSWAHLTGPRYCGVDGYDWEWSADVQPLTIKKDGAIVAEVRLRRDAGMLCVFANILDPGPSHVPEKMTEGTVIASKIPGLELMLGPMQGTVGNTQIVITPGGIARAYRPGSPPLMPSIATVRLENNGRPSANEKPGTKPIDFSSGLQPIPGASVAVKGRFDGQGYRIEAEIPLSAFPDLVSESLVQVERQNNVKFSERRADFDRPLKFNAAVWIGDGMGGVNRHAWITETTDIRQLNSAEWGILNGQIELAWPEVDGAVAYNIYRADSADPGKATLAFGNLATLRATDVPGLEAYYWLAPVTKTGEGQWFGPLRPTRGAVIFPNFDAAAPVPIDDLANRAFDIYPGVPLLINVAVDSPDFKVTSEKVEVEAAHRTEKTVALVIRSQASDPSQKITLAAAGKTVTFSLLAAPVPVMAYGVIGDVMTNITGTDPTGARAHADIDSSKPADGAAGQPAAFIGWMGNGQISQRDIGRHGYVLPRWSGGQVLRRVVKGPFIDSFAGLKTENGQFGNINWNVDGEKAEGPNRVVMYGTVTDIRPGSTFTVPIRTNDGQPHLLTVVTDKRGLHLGPPAEFTVADPATKRSWRVADFDGTQGCTVFQFTFKGNIDLTVTAILKSDEGYNRANISAIFLD